MAFLSTTGYAGSIKRIQGYRPIEVTLIFEDGSKAVPDSIGIPRLGNTFYVGPEILSKSDRTSEVTTLGVSQTLGSQTRNPGIDTIIRSSNSFTTAHKPIVSGNKGASIKLFWHSSSDTLPSESDIPISPDKVIIDSRLGTLEILDTFPNGKDNVIAYYHSIITEFTPKILNSQWDQLINNTSAGLIGFNVDAGMSQSYPITRNKTDYMYGKSIELNLPNLDKTSPDYYPVFEYIINDNGELQFAVPLNKYSDYNAKVEVKYSSLKLEPRFIIEMYREEESSVSDELKEIQLLVETQK